MYSIEKRIGYSDCDKDGNVTLFSIMNVLQDIGAFFNEDMNVGERYLEKNDLAWIVYNWNIEIYKNPNILKNSKLTVKTAAYYMKGSISNRYYEILDSNDNLMIKAYSTWVLIKYSTGHPLRLTDEIRHYIEEDKKNISLDYKVEKCILENQKDFKICTTIDVPLYYIDRRGHMNNARYLEYLHEFIEVNNIKKIYINYQIPLIYKQKAIIKKYVSDKITYFEYCNDLNETACLIKIQYR